VYEIQTFKITQDGDTVIVLHDMTPISDDEGVMRWGSEKTALQWLRRRCEKVSGKYEIFKLDNTPIYMDYADPPRFTLGHHEWKKANVMALADGKGPYDKLVCSFCGGVVRRYRSQRHFREELEICESNKIPLPLETK
jgi:hypothetical protein